MKTGLATREGPVLIAEPESHPATPAAVGVLIEGSGLAARRRRQHPHHAAPFALLELGGVVGFVIAPEDRHWTLVEVKVMPDHAVHGSLLSVHGP